MLLYIINVHKVNTEALFFKMAIPCDLLKSLKKK